MVPAPRHEIQFQANVSYPAFVEVLQRTLSECPNELLEEIRRRASFFQNTKSLSPYGHHPSEFAEAAILALQEQTRRAGTTR